MLAESSLLGGQYGVVVTESPNRPDEAASRKADSFI
jgi:hypothetical protein